MAERRRRSDLFEIAILTAMIIWMGIGFVIHAQTQDFLNGSFTAQFASVNARLDRIENMFQFAATALVGSLIAQLVSVVNQIRNRERRYDASRASHRRD